MKNPAHDLVDLRKCVRLCTEDCHSVLELGSEFGDRIGRDVAAPVRIGVEIYEPYVREAMKSYPAVTFLRGDARDLEEQELFLRGSVDGVMMVDFLEHLHKVDGRELLEYAKALARKRVIIFGPEGFIPSPTGKAMETWTRGFGGEYWQRHRSGWTAEDLLGFDVAVWPNYFNDQKKGAGALFGIWEP